MKLEMELAIKQVAPEVVKQIWNDAIEAAAKLAQWSDVADKIRKLKK